MLFDKRDPLLLDSSDRGNKSQCRRKRGRVRMKVMLMRMMSLERERTGIYILLN